MKVGQLWRNTLCEQIRFHYAPSSDAFKGESDTGDPLAKSFTPEQTRHKSMDSLTELICCNCVYHPPSQSFDE